MKGEKMTNHPLTWAQADKILEAGGTVVVRGISTKDRDPAVSECPEGVFDLDQSEELIRSVWAAESAQKDLSQAFEVYRDGGRWSDYAAAIDARAQAARVFDDAIAALRRVIAKLLTPVEEADEPFHFYEATSTDPVLRRVDLNLYERT